MRRTWELRTPLGLEVKRLRVGDRVLLSGRVWAARDVAHRLLVEALERGEPLPFDIRGQAIYYLGPSPAPPGRPIGAAGPTTSAREEPYEHRIIGELGLRAVIGKGGMFDRTLGACQEHGAVYLHAVGGAASLIAERVVEVEDVYKTEFGLPEAFWRIRVEDFQCVVTMDSHGGSLHKEVLAASQERYQEIMGG